MSTPPLKPLQGKSLKKTSPAPSDSPNKSPALGPLRAPEPSAVPLARKPSASRRKAPPPPPTLAQRLSASTPAERALAGSSLALILVLAAWTFWPKPQFIESEDPSRQTQNTRGTVYQLRQLSEKAQESMNDRVQPPVSADTPFRGFAPDSQGGLDLPRRGMGVREPPPLPAAVLSPNFTPPRAPAAPAIAPGASAPNATTPNPNEPESTFFPTLLARPQALSAAPTRPVSPPPTPR